MTKGEYLNKIKNENKSHISNLQMQVKMMNFNIEKLKVSKNYTDNIADKFGIKSYNYNLVDEVNEIKVELLKNLEDLIRQIQKISARKSNDIDYDIQRMQGIGDLLYSYETQLSTINKCDLSDLENLQLNAIKKEIYEKFMRRRAEIDRAILMEKFEKMKNRSTLIDFIYDFLVIKEVKDLEREHVFSAIKGIDDCVAKYEEGSMPTCEYKILDILADIEVYMNENKKIKKFKEQYGEIRSIKDNIYSTFLIEKKDLKKAINNRYQSKYPMPVEKNVTKIKKSYKKMIEFLYKSGYAKSCENVQSMSKMNLVISKIEKLSANVKAELER